MGLFNRNKNPDIVPVTEPDLTPDTFPAADDTPAEVSAPDPVPAPQPEPAPQPQPEPAPQPEPEKPVITEQDTSFVPGPETPYERERHSRRLQLLNTSDIFWSWVLMGIPVIGWLVAIFWAAGLVRKRQKRDLARAFLIRMAVLILIYAIAYAVYTVIFNYDIDDLPTVIKNVSGFIWNGISSLFKKS